MELELGEFLAGWRYPRRRLGRRRRRRFLEHMAYVAIFRRTSCLELAGIGGSECGIVGQWQVGQSSTSRFLGIGRFGLRILERVGMVVAGQLEQIVVGSIVVGWWWFGSSVGFELGCIGMAASGLELEWWQHLVGSKRWRQGSARSVGCWWSKCMLVGFVGMGTMGIARI